MVHKAGFGPAGPRFLAGDPNGCAGPSSYSAELINDAVLKEIRRFLTVIRDIPQEDLLERAREKHDGVNEVAYRTGRFFKPYGKGT